jgi:tetratricopeptide (TPR) repeat protein
MQNEDGSVGGRGSVGVLGSKKNIFKDMRQHHDPNTDTENKANNRQRNSAKN